MRMFLIAADERTDRPYVAPEFSAQLPRLADRAASPLDLILRLTPESWASRMVSRAFELNLFGELADRPLDAESLRRRLRLPQRGARNFFDALVGLGLIERQNGRYANGAQGNFWPMRLRQPDVKRPETGDIDRGVAGRTNTKITRIRQSTAAKAGRVPQQGDKVDA